MADNDALLDRYHDYRRQLGFRANIEYGVRARFGAASAQCATAQTTTENLYAAYSGLCAVCGYAPDPAEVLLTFLSLEL